MRTYILILLTIFTLTIHAQEQTIREATAAEINAGTAGFPATVTPRRLAGGGFITSGGSFTGAVTATGGNVVTTNSNFYMNKAVEGAAWGAMQRPWIFLYHSPYNTVDGKPAETESTILTNLLLMAASGDFGRITNGGEQFAYYFDVGWEAGRLSVQGTNLAYNWPYILTNWGTYVWDTNKYPHGLPWIINVLHSNKINVVAQIIGYPKPLIPGADAYILPAAGTGYIGYWTNGNGVFPTNSFGRMVTATTPDTAKHDISEFMRWGFDGFVMADNFYPLDNFLDMDLEYGNDALRVSVPNGYNNPLSFTAPTPVTNYYNIDTSKLDSSQVGIYQGDLLAMEVFGKPMAYFAYQTRADESHTFGYVSSHNHAGVYYENSNQGTSYTGLDAILRDFPTTKHANEGSYVFWTSTGGYADATAIALTHGLTVHGFTNNPVLNSYNSYLNMITNVGWQQIHNDLAQNWPRRTDYISGTNIGSIYIEDLYDGSKAVGFFNKTSNASYIPLNWAQLGWPSNLNVQITAIVDQSTINSVALTNGTYTNGFTYGMVGFGSGLFKFTPLPPVQLASQFNLGSFSTKNTNDSIVVMTGWSGSALTPQLMLTRGQPWAGGNTDSNVVISVYGAGNFSGGYTPESEIQLQVDNNLGFGAVFNLFRDNATATYWAGIGTKSGAAMVQRLDCSDGGVVRIWGTGLISNGLNVVNGGITNNAFTGNGGGLTNLATSTFTNINSGQIYTNPTTRVLSFRVPSEVSEPAGVLGSAEVDAQIHAPGAAFVSVDDLSIAGGITSIIQTNRQNLIFDVPSGWAFVITNTVSGAGYNAKLDSTKTNQVTSY